LESSNPAKRFNGPVLSDILVLNLFSNMLIHTSVQKMACDCYIRDRPSKFLSLYI
jgi:hypothetical protein